MRSKRGRSVAIAAVVAAGLALVVSACGGGSSGGNSNTGTTSSSTGKTFSTLKVVWGPTDYVDPGLSYRLESWQFFQDVYEPLLTKAHVDCTTGNCAQIIPALAQSLPKVTNGAKTYTMTIRSGLKYSDGTPIKASDFEASIVRDFKLNSPGIGFYANIVGSDACEANPTKCKSISGIVSDDSKGTVTINLKSPESDFEYVLTLPFSTPLPPSTPATPQGSGSSAPAADGPYYIANYSANKSFTLKRNPNWKTNEMPGIPNGNPDVIQATIVGDQAQSAQMVASNQVDYDENVLPTDRLAQLQSKYKNQIRFFTTPSTYYLFLNEGLAPFNNLKARQAINYAVDRSQIVKIFGGLGKETQNFLPPTYPQYKKINPYPYNLAKAKQLVQQSGTAGTKVTVYGERDVEVSSATATYIQGVLNSIGYKADLRLLNSGNYFTILGNQSTKAQIGYTDWFEDYPYPSDWFYILLDGDTITQVHNNNYGLVNFKDVNAKIATLDHLPPSQATSAATNAQWAAIDNELQTKYAATVPMLNRVLTSFFSTRMSLSCDINDDDYDDVAQFCLK